MKRFIQIYLYFIYPIYSIWFASNASLIMDNLSIVGNLKGMRFYFILWAILCEIALGIGFFPCIKKSTHKNIFTSMLLISAAMFSIAILLPYLPESYPVLSELHITLSFIGLLSMLFVAALLVMNLSLIYKIYPFDIMMIGIYGCALGIYGANYMSVNSLVEIFLGIILPIYLFHLKERLK